MNALIDSLDLWLVACIFYGLLVLGPENRKDRILNILIGIDQALWTLITAGNGSPDETTSAGATACLMKAATTANGSGNNATQITAVKIA